LKNLPDFKNCDQIKDLEEEQIHTSHLCMVNCSMKSYETCMFYEQCMRGKVRGF